MKKMVISIILILSLTACSLQEKMSTELFFKRLEKYDSSISVNDSFYDGESFVIYSLYHNAEIVFEISTDTDKSIKKINLACSDTDKINEFVDCVESVMTIYTSDDTHQEIIECLFENKSIDNEFRYYDTQWHKYSAILSDNGLYFSVSNKKLIPESEVEFSLKQNDIIEY